jgi:perosamine synthetase
MDSNKPPDITRVAYFLGKRGREMERLAIEGGKPVRNTLLPYGQQWLEEDDIAAVTNVLRSPFITQGPAITAFEEAVARYVGADYAVAFCNGTAALHAACYAAGVGTGDEVITTPITFVASANCALYMGARPVFVDIDPHTYNLNPDLLEQAITPRTKAIVAVDFTGQPADMDPIRQVADKHGLVVIEDAAHSLGATYKGNKVGTLADMTMFSFHPVKHVTTGEGGVIVTNSSALAEKLRLFRSHGITREHVTEEQGGWYYEMLDLGYNYRITDIQAALGLSQMKKLDSFIERRREIAGLYNEAFQAVDGLILPYQLPETNSSWHLYMLRFDLTRFYVGRRKIFEALRAENIGVNVHYIPVYLQPYYRKLGYSSGLCPVAEAWYEEVITLPLFPKMKDEDVKDVIQAVYKTVHHYHR